MGDECKKKQNNYTAVLFNESFNNEEFIYLELLVFGGMVLI